MNQDLVLALAGFVVLAWVSLVAVILGALLGGVVQMCVDAHRRKKTAEALRQAILAEIHDIAREAQVRAEGARKIQGIFSSGGSPLIASPDIIEAPIWARRNERRPHGVTVKG